MRKFYGHEWRGVIRPRILERYGNLCEHCGVPNRTWVWRLGGSWWIRNSGQWYSPDGSEPWRWRHPRFVRTVLTVAHLNHVAGDDRDENLKALCQWCHLHWDLLHHAHTRAARKDAARPLLQLA